MKSKANYKLAIISLIAANALWGAAFPIYKIVLTHVPPFTFGFLRFFISCLILLPFTYKNLKIKPRDLITLILLSITGITLAITFLNFGLTLSSSINAPIILSSSPIFLIIGSLLFLKEKIKAKVVIGTLVSFAGVLIIVLIPVLSKGIDGSITGNVFFVFAGFFSVISALLTKKIIGKYNVLTITFWSFLIGSLPLIPLVINEYNQTHWISNLNQETILGLAFAVLICTAIARSMNDFGLKYIAANEVGVFSYVDPITTIVVAIPLLHETISTPYVVGSMLVFLGIIVAEKRLNYHPFHKLLS